MVNAPTNPSKLMLITNACNIKCPDCLFEKTLAGKGRTRRDLTLDEFKRNISGIDERYSIHFAGGEPTLHPELEEMIRLVAEQKALSHIITNGISFTKTQRQADSFVRRLRRASENGSILITMSIDDQHALGSNNADLKKRAARFRLACERAGVKHTHCLHLPTGTVTSTSRSQELIQKYGIPTEESEYYRGANVNVWFAQLDRFHHGTEPREVVDWNGRGHSTQASALRHLEGHHG